MSDYKPIIAVTMGDAAGSGPELTVKALSEKSTHQICRPVVVGDESVMERAVGIVRSKARINSITKLESANFKRGEIDVLDVTSIDMDSLMQGGPSPLTGKAAVDCIKFAVNLALRGAVDAITTSPVSKESINMAGFKYPGHTELLADLTHCNNYALMLVSKRLKVVHVTTHIPLREVFNHLSKESISKKIVLTRDALEKYFGLARPSIAVSGLNPHAGESGLLGNEDIKIVAPAIEETKRLGIDVSGPYPPDTIFLRAYSGEFDAVVAMYHDQGHIAVKMVGFKDGVNVTIGLPIIRTSPDHGTVWDKAGKGTADPAGTMKAIEIASFMAENKAARRMKS